MKVAFWSSHLTEVGGFGEDVGLGSNITDTYSTYQVLVDFLK